jgi:DNA repair protein RadC
VGLFNLSFMSHLISEIKVSYKQKHPLGPTVISSAVAHSVLRPLFDQDLMEVREEFIVLYLNRANRVKGWYRISAGGLTGTIADTRLILGIALKSASCNIILSHNHPSGNLTASKEDTELTSSIKQAGKVMNINVLDHIIITNDDYMSFADTGLL